MDKTLFQNQYLAVIDREGYIFSREVRCDGKIVSVLPFRKTDTKMEYLARLEICPAHGPELELCSITGGVDQGQTPPGMAKQELWEEAGYETSLDALISLGEVRPSKSADTIAYLFAVDVTGKDPMFAPGDGTRFEAGSSVQWVDLDQGIEIADPLMVTAIVRLTRLIGKSF